MANLSSALKYVLLAGLPVLLAGIFVLLAAFWNMSLLHQLLLVIAVVLIGSSQFFMHSMRVVGSIAWKRLLKCFVESDSKSFLEDHFYDAIVLPSDLDMFLHMNNARYPREADFARTTFYGATGFGSFLWKTRTAMLMTASAMRFRKSLELFQRFRIKTKVICWTEEAFYIEHKFLSKYNDMDDFVYCVILTKMNVSKETTDSALRAFFKQDAAPKSPEPSEEVAQFIKYNEASSQALKTAGLQANDADSAGSS